MIYDFNENVLRKRNELKESIKRTSGKCAIVLLLLSISTYLLGSIIIRILKFKGMLSGVDLGIDNDLGTILGISKDAYNFWVGYFPCIVADVIAISACIFIFKKKINVYTKSKKEVSIRFLISSSFASIGVGIISSIIFLIYSIIINSQGIEIPSPDFSIPQSKIYLILFMTYTCFLAPVFEEIIFRGYILNNLRKYGNITAIIVSSIFFSMFHFNLVQLVNPILMGIVLSLVMIKSESIVTPIIVHMFNNIMAMLTTVISVANFQDIIFIWSTLYYLIGTSALFYFLFKYGREFINIVKGNNRFLSNRKKILYSFINKWTIAYILFYGFIVTITIVAQNR